jgi:hypothetical protein
MTQKLTDHITDLYIDNYNVCSFDDERYLHAADGTLNVKHNMGDKYLLGGRCDQAAYALTAAKAWRDEAEKRNLNNIEANGADDIKSRRSQADLSKAEAKLENAQMFFEIDTNLFYTMTGVIWGDANVTDDNGRQWWTEYKEQMRGGNTDPVPTKKALNDRKAMLKARAADPQTAAAVA